MIRHLNVLVVDDDPAILEVVATYLGDRGYAVTTCASGLEGLAALRDQPVDLVLSDINMEGMNGLEFLRLARRNYPGVGIVLMTGFDAQFPLAEALRAGADGYITKPFGLRKLSLLFDRAYWAALSRQDWWDARDDGVPDLVE